MSEDILQYLPALRAFARSLCGNSTDADDLVQETLLRSIENISGYTPGTNLRAWLFTIMRNRFYSNCIKRGRERTGDEDCVSQQPSVAPGQEWPVRMRELERALGELPIHYREAIVLVIVLEESYLRAAEILECDIGTIKSRINRGRHLLRAALGETV
jgi:RNA polymerase sigma-70 factor (ECF subfamily)